MELTTAQQLADLNRRFYEDHAAAFARSRSTPQPGIQRVLAMIPHGARVLEIGCGDGKVARALAANSGVSAYLGLDLSPAMLERARVNLTQDERSPRETAPGHLALGFRNSSFVILHSSLGIRHSSFGIRHSSFSIRHSSFGTLRGHFSFALADFVDPGWTRALPPEPFDNVLAFAVFHHLPGGQTRAHVLRTLGERLAPGGALVMSNWQFVRSQRLQRRIVPWSTLNMSEADVEPGDYLLTWERNHRRGLRYVHLLDEAEARRMAEAAGLHVVEVFCSDGVSNDLADYVIMQKPE